MVAFLRKHDSAAAGVSLTALAAVPMRLPLQVAFDGRGFVARRAVGGGILLGDGSDEANDLQHALGLEGLGHADNGSEIVAGGVVSGLGIARDENHGNAREAFAVLDDKAKIVSGCISRFDFGDEACGNGGAQDIERRGCRGNDKDVVAFGR